MKTQKELFIDFVKEFELSYESRTIINVWNNRQRQEAIKECKRFIKENYVLKDGYKYYEVLMFLITYYSITEEELR